MVSSVAMTAITTSSSIRVKPRRLPVMVGHSVEPGARRARVHVVDVLARLWIVGRARVGTQPPGVRGRRGRVRPERIARQASQEVDLDALLGAARIVHPVDQRPQLGWIPGLVELFLDVAGVPSQLVGIELSADSYTLRPPMSHSRTLVH